jgi:hypothetical protein
MNTELRDVARVHVASANTDPVTELCIRSIHRFAGYPFQLCIGDVGSGDGSVATLQALEAAGWIDLEIADRWKLHAEWLDGWLAACDQRFAVFVDSDVCFERPGWLREMVDTALETGAAMVCAKLDQPQEFDRGKTGRATVVTAPRPSAHLMLIDVPKVRGITASFWAVEEPDPEVPGRIVSFDVAAKFYSELVERGGTCVTMPPEFAASFVHFGGLSWYSRKLWPHLWPGWHQVKALSVIRLRRRLYRLRFKSPSPDYVAVDRRSTVEVLAS